MFYWLGQDVAVACKQHAFLGVEVDNFAKELELFVGMKGLGTGVVEVFIPEEPELVEGGEDQIDPGLDCGGGLVFMTGEFLEAEVPVLQLDPRGVEEAVHDGVCSD